MFAGHVFSGKMFSGLDLEYIKSLVDQQYEEQPTEKMGKRHEQTQHKRRRTNSQEAQEKVLNFTSHQRNAN